MDKKIEESQKDILDAMQKSYGKKRLIPFIGAGLSRNIDQKYVNFENLINVLGNEIKVPSLYDNFHKNPLRASEYYILKKGEQALKNGRVKKTGNEKEDIFLAGKKK